MQKSKHSLVNLSVSLPQDLRDAARQAAFDDNRSLSSLIASALKGQLLAEGYLTRPGASAGGNRRGRRCRRQHR